MAGRLIIGLDVGGCISRMWTNYEGHVIYKAVDVGFTAFVMLWKEKYKTLDDLHIISRTKNGQWMSWHYSWHCAVECYVVRVVRASGLTTMGLADVNIHLTDGKGLGSNAKGPVLAPLLSLSLRFVL